MRERKESERSIWTGLRRILCMNMKKGMNTLSLFGGWRAGGEGEVMSRGEKKEKDKSIWGSRGERTENNKQEEICKCFPLNPITEEVKESCNFLTDLGGREEVLACEEVRVREGESTMEASVCWCTGTAPVAWWQLQGKVPAAWLEESLVWLSLMLHSSSSVRRTTEVWKNVHSSKSQSEASRFTSAPTSCGVQKIPAAKCLLEIRTFQICHHNATLTGLVRILAV